MDAAEPTWRGTPSSEASQTSTLALVAGALAVALAIGPLAFAEARAVLLALAGLAGVVALVCLLALAAHRTGAALFVLLFLLVTIPGDKYFGYRPHVGGWPGVRLAVVDLAALPLAGLAAVAWWLGRGRRALPGALLACLSLIALQYAISAAGSSRRDLALLELCAILHGVAIAWLIAATFQRRFLEPVLAVLAVQVVLHSAFALLQVVTGRPIGAGAFGGPEKVMSEALATGVDRLRPSGLFVHPIVYADFLFLSLPLLGGGLLASRSRWLRCLLGLALASGLVGLALTLSRGAWLASLVAGGVLLALAVRRGLLDRRALRRVLQAAGVALLLATAAFGPRVYERLTASEAGNLDVRLDLNRIALRMVVARPLLGHGVNAFVESMEPYDPKNVMAYFPAPAHNLYLLEAAEAGLPALALLVALFAIVLSAAVRGLARTAEPALAWTVAAIAAGLCGLLVSQLADFSLRLEPLRTFVWALIGLLFGVLRAAGPKAAGASSRRGTAMAAASGELVGPLAPGGVGAAR